MIAVPDSLWGEAVKAVVVAKNHTNPCEKDIINFIRQRIAHYKYPKSVDFINKIPRNTNGKILHTIIQEPYWPNRDKRVA